MSGKLWFYWLLLCTSYANCQNFQLHYDFRGSLDPESNTANFPVFNFEYFKNIDTLESGSFLLKLDARMGGSNNNIDQVFTQVSQSLRFWQPKIFLNLTYSGGLGVTTTAFGYYMVNSFGIGISYPFQWKGTWISTSTGFRINMFDKPSYDPQLTFYFGKGFISYKMFVSGSFVFWSQNLNQGNDFTSDLSGKRFVFFGDPQLWVRIRKGFSTGTRINVYYHLLSESDKIQIYPTLGIKYQF